MARPMPAGKAIRIGLLLVLPIALAAWLLVFNRPDVVPQVIPQVWASSGTTYAETDSLAVCEMANGAVHLFATSKNGHRIDVFDAATGKFLEAFGSEGTQPGQFNRPNGIVTVRLPVADKDGAKATRSALLVIERDGARVQAFWADSLKPAGIFGSKELKKPYGGAVHERGDEVTVYITDAKAEDDACVFMYRLEAKGEEIVATLIRQFGDSGGAGRIRLPESVVVDEKMQRVLLCDEKQNDVKVYTLDGKFTGTVFADGLVRRDPEGLVIVEHLGPAGVVILTDQREEISIWLVFDRRDYRLLAAFTGKPNIANTDGICVHPKPFGPFTGGALFAVHDDADIRAYDLADVAALLTQQAADESAAASQAAH